MFVEDATKYAVDGGLLVAIGATTVEQTGLLPGHIYEFAAIGGMALCRWGADAAATADAGFDFAVPAGGKVRARCPTGDTAINVIEAEASSTATATLAISRVTHD